MAFMNKIWSKCTSVTKSNALAQSKDVKYVSALNDTDNTGRKRELLTSSCLLYKIAYNLAVNRMTFFCDLLILRPTFKKIATHVL